MGLRQSSAPTVAVRGHYGNRNLGDEAIVAATITGIRRYLPNASFFAISLDPADSAVRHGVAAFPLRRTARSDAVWQPPTGQVLTPRQPTAPAVGPADRTRVPRVHRRRLVPLVRRALRPLRRSARAAADTLAELRFLLRVARFLGRVDLVVIAGSNQFLDNFGGAAGFPFTLLKWTVLARMRGTPVAVTSVGAGPLTGRASRLMVRLVLRLADRVSYRDAGSRALAEGPRSVPIGDVRPDLAFSLQPSHGPRRDCVKRIGVNVMPVYDGRYWPDARPERYARYVDAMAATVAGLLQRDLDVFLYATQPGDELVIADVQHKLSESGGPAVAATGASTLEDLLTTITSADLLIATRFHGTVLALTCGRPVVSVCYHRKTADLMAELGLADGLRAERLLTCVDQLRRQLPSIHGRIDAALERHRDALEEQFVRLARMASGDDAAMLAPVGAGAR